MSVPAVPSVVERAYALLEPLAQHDTDGAYLILALANGILGGDDELWQMLEHPGLAAYLDPASTPEQWLPLDAAINGARITEGMTDDQRRVEIAHPSGWARCLPATVLANVARWLIPGATPLLLQRYDPQNGGDQPNDHTLVVHYTDILPGALNSLIAEFELALPGGDVPHVVPNAYWGDEAARHGTWGAAAAAHTTWESLAKGH